MSKTRILNFFFLFFVVLMIFSGYKIVTILKEYRSGENTYTEVQQYVHLPTTEAAVEEMMVPVVDSPSTTPVTKPEEEPIPFPEVDFEALQKVNDDVVAWIYIEDTQINYPVVQGNDNTRYLNTMIDGSYNGAGSIFMDYRNQPDISDVHTILYGHNMKNKTMFAGILNYKDPDYFISHPTGMLMTPDGNYLIEFVAAYVADPSDSTWQLDFQNDEEALQWMQTAMRRSTFAGNTVPALGDQYITLSSCSYEYNDARFVLVGILKET